jgi:two-component system, chemotaxis family, protein-glutamate methylesterase/glutaminase
MIVDDSAVVRGLIARVLHADAEIEIVASVDNGRTALASLERVPADIAVLDIEMPEMDGLTAIPLLLKRQPSLKILMASTLTRHNAEIALKALALGAADYVPKPTASREMLGATPFNQELLFKIHHLGGLPSGGAPGPGARMPEIASSGQAPARPRAIAVGSSTGGPQALLRVLRDAGPLRQPVFLTQHMPPTFTTLLAQNIARDCRVEAREAVDGEAVAAGRVYVAPGNHHMVVHGASPGLVSIALNQEPPENFCRPAVDPMLRSLVACYGSALLVVILTGMGHDGLEGCRAVVAAGGAVLAQDQASSVVWGMPGAVAHAGLCSAVLPLERIGPRLREIASVAVPAYGHIAARVR